MEIHLSKPGGKREGPYGLNQVNADLAAGKYSGADYWAWHDGLPEWVPLYSIPGVIEPGAPAHAGLHSHIPHDTEILPAEALPSFVAEETKPPPAIAPAADIDLTAVSSGMPFAALEEIFILSTGQGPAASRSATTAAMLERIIGEDLHTIRAQVPRDVIALCDILEGLKGKSSTPGAVWAAMAALKPELLQQARDGLYRICIRTFRIENGDLVSVFLFYNKQKL